MFRPLSHFLAGSLWLVLTGLAALAQEAKPAAEKRPPEVITPAAGDAATALAKINKKLETIVFPRLEFREATIGEAVDFLVQKSKQLDPDNEGVNIVLKLSEAKVGAPAREVPGVPGFEEAPLRRKVNGPASGGINTKITLSLNNVPLLEVLKYVTNLSNLRYKVDPFAVSIVPMTASEMRIREWKLPATVFQGQGGPVGIPGAANPGKAELVKARDYLAEKGVTFENGALATYSRSTSILTVKNTDDQLDLVEQIVKSATTVRDDGQLILPRIEFKESRLSEAVDFLLARVPDVNILVQKNVRDIVVSFSLRNVTLEQAMEALEFTTAGQITVSRPAENIFQISRTSRVDDEDNRPQVRIFSLATYLGRQKEEPALEAAIVQFQETLRSAVEMLRAADPTSEAQAPRLQVNPSTKLLIAVGRKSDLALVEQLAAAVEGHAVAVPERSGMGQPRMAPMNPPPTLIPGLPSAPSPAKARPVPGASNGLPSPTPPNRQPTFELPGPTTPDEPEGIHFLQRLPVMGPLFEVKRPGLRRN